MRAEVRPAQAACAARIQSDRLQNLDFDPEVVEKERNVVYSERRTSIDNNNMRGPLAEKGLKYIDGEGDG